MLVSARNERQQSEFISQNVLELREEGVPLTRMAVLFRSGFLSFDLEIELNRANIPYQKFGGMKFIETAHIKDLLAYLKIVSNPRDSVSWQRALLLLDGVGPRTAISVVGHMSDSNIRFSDYNKLGIKGLAGASLKDMFDLLKEIDASKLGVGQKSAFVAEYYKPLLMKKYDDWQKRWRDIEMFVSIAERYKSVQSFLNDMAIEPPIESLSGLEKDDNEDEYLTLSTIHSAKGLEWEVVMLIWALEGRFPSSRSGDSIDSMEEERRLFYVACTRAIDRLCISYPTNIYDRESGFVMSEPSRFIRGFDEEILEKFVLMDEENDEGEQGNGIV